MGDDTSNVSQSKIQNDVKTKMAEWNPPVVALIPLIVGGRKLVRKRGRDNWQKHIFSPTPPPLYFLPWKHLQSNRARKALTLIHFQSALKHSVDILCCLKFFLKYLKILPLARSCAYSSTLDLAYFLFVLNFSHKITGRKSVRLSAINDTLSAGHERHRFPVFVNIAEEMAQMTVVGRAGTMRLMAHHISELNDNLTTRRASVLPLCSAYHMFVWPVTPAGATGVFQRWQSPSITWATRV